MIVRTCRIDGNQRYSWMRNQRSLFVSRTRPSAYALRQSLMSKHRILSFKPQLRLEWRGQDGQNETEQPDHSANLGDSITASTRIRFSVHTTCRWDGTAPFCRSKVYCCTRIGSTGSALTIAPITTISTFRIDGNQRYSWTKNHRSRLVSWTRPCGLRLKTIN
jgi:hypothetical protein